MRFGYKFTRMKRWLLLMLVVIVAISLAVAFRSYVKSEAKKKREADYQSALQAYSHDLRPGLTRPQVENHLRSKGAPFTQMCCVDERSALADLVKIGEEDHPWYCSEHYVFLAFEFAGTNRSSRLDHTNLTC